MKIVRLSPSDKLIRLEYKCIFQSSAQTAFKSLRLLRRRLDLKKQSSLRTDCSQPSLRDGTMISKTSGGGERAQRSKKFNLGQTKSKLHIVKLHVVFNISLFLIKFILILYKMCSAKKI